MIQKIDRKFVKISEISQKIYLNRMQQKELQIFSTQILTLTSSKGSGPSYIGSNSGKE